ncbi:Hypothetical predicted protein [Octopus vulgaris]|uniref:Uncharacterized protein n=2 Tax=Octopus TaxID=6643 RepID=A0AA36ALU3_OCTVU|nr:pre-mRNA-splicing factor SYF2 [Octopus sinensis]CAI9718575.1 Hypothetical predicted protein [Octopus vulgaris]
MFKPRSLATKKPAPTAEEQEAARKRKERSQRLQNLQLRMNEARKLNHQEVAEEDRKKRLPANYEEKRKRLEWEEEELKKQKECSAKGEDYDQVKLLDISAVDAEKWERKKKKKNPDPGFSDYEAATFRQYQRNTKQIKPDMDSYFNQMEKKGEEFFPDANTLGLQQHTDSEKAVDRMVNDLEKQINKREKYSRRRPYDEAADIDYINERNMKFNKKLERFYGKYTAEIKQNLERGTAV